MLTSRTEGKGPRQSARTSAALPSVSDRPRKSSRVMPSEPKVSDRERKSMDPDRPAVSDTTVAASVADGFSSSV
jgi:hypothetical protein